MISTWQDSSSWNVLHARKAPYVWFRVNILSSSLPEILCLSVKVSITQSFWDGSPRQVSLMHVNAAYYNDQRRHKLGQKEISGHGPNLQAFFFHYLRFEPWNSSIKRVCNFIDPPAAIPCSARNAWKNSPCLGYHLFPPSSVNGWALVTRGSKEQLWDPWINTWSQEYILGHKNNRTGTAENWRVCLQGLGGM